MKLTAAPDLIPAVYRGPWDRAALAGLAPVVLTCADDGDATALAIVTTEACELAETAAAAARNFGLAAAPVPVALAGGLLLGSDLYRETLLTRLAETGVRANPVTPVADPCVGAVLLARRLAAS